MQKEILYGKKVRVCIVYFHFESIAIIKNLKTRELLRINKYVVWKTGVLINTLVCLHNNFIYADKKIACWLFYWVNSPIMKYKKNIFKNIYIRIWKFNVQLNTVYRLTESHCDINYFLCESRYDFWTPYA